MVNGILSYFLCLQERRDCRKNIGQKIAGHATSPRNYRYPCCAVLFFNSQFFELQLKVKTIIEIARSYEKKHHPHLT